MNTRSFQTVSGGSRQARAFAAILILCSLWTLLNSQCVGIDGGASELTWSLRTFEGNSVSCSRARVDQIRLCWNNVEEDAQGCRPGQFRDFACEDQTGVTLFEIPTGSTRLFVQPICTDGMPAAVGSYQAPSDIVRTVREGEIVTLDSLLIVVTEPRASCGVECTCVR